MENSDARAVRRVRCPRCHCVLEEPGAPVYQCGGCGTSLRAKNRTGTGSARDAGARASPSRSSLPPPPPPPSRHLDASDVASTSRSSTPTGPTTPSHPHVGTSWHHQATDATSSQHGSGDLVPARRRGASAGIASTSSTTPDHTTSSRRQGTDAMTSRREPGDLVPARRSHGSGEIASTSSTPDATTSSRHQGTKVTTSRRESGDLVSVRRSHAYGEVASTSSTPDATASSRRQGTDATTGRRESGDHPVAARNRVSEQVALIDNRGREQGSAGQEVHDDSGGGIPRDAGGNKEAASELQDDDTEKRMKRQAESTDAARKKPSAKPAAAQPAREDAAGGGKAPSPSRQELQEENLGPLRKKILKTVDELKGDLSELFSKSPELNQTRARPPRLPKQEGRASGPAATAAAAGITARPRHAAAATDGHHRGNAARAVKPAPPRGLPSRRYRQCRAHPCYHHVEPPRSCHHHGCCRHHGRPECSSCRGHCCRPRTQEPSAPRKPPAAKEPKRRPPPRNHCRPVLKGAPFIVCSSCFKLVQVPADFAISTRTVRKLRCGACSTVLSYSYRDPARKKVYQDSIDRCSIDGSEVQCGRGGGEERPDLFAPFVDGFGPSSYSTEDEPRLPVSRNTSFDTLDGTKGVGRLHRLMGYGSASELLRHSPDLYESFSERTTPDVRQYDRKGKGVCVDDNDYDVDDSDEEDIGALKRSAAKGSGWPLPWMIGEGTPAPGAIRIN